MSACEKAMYFKNLLFHIIVGFRLPGKMVFENNMHCTFVQPLVAIEIP